MKTKLVALATVLAAMAAASDAPAQMYSTGPGFYMSLEGPYIKNQGDRTRAFSAGDPASDKFSEKRGNDKDLGGKVGGGYRFDNNWDVGVSAGGMRSGR